MLALSPCAAEHLLSDSDIPVVRHEKRRSSVPLGFNGEGESRAFAGILFSEDPYRKKSGLEARLLSYDPLDDCKEPNVELREVFHHSPGSERYDVVYYNGASDKQRRHARRYRGRSVAYQAALLDGENGEEPDQWQVLARLVRIRCLPTRFHFTYIGSKRYLSYRSGEKAWEHVGAEGEKR